MSKEKENKLPQEEPQATERAETAAAEANAPEQDALLEALQEEKERYLRLMAEFDNYKKRTQKEKEGLRQEVKAQTVLALLPVLDNLERALSFKDSAEGNLKEGMTLVHRQMKECFSGLGVSEIESEGAVFDPSVHEAVAHEEREDTAESTITAVLQKGYKVGDRVIRHAAVKVAN